MEYGSLENLEFENGQGKSGNISFANVMELSSF